MDNLIISGLPRIFSFGAGQYLGDSQHTERDLMELIRLVGRQLRMCMFSSSTAIHLVSSFGRLRSLKAPCSEDFTLESTAGDILASPCIAANARIEITAKMEFSFHIATCFCVKYIFCGLLHANGYES